MARDKNQARKGKKKRQNDSSDDEDFQTKKAKANSDSDSDSGPDDKNEPTKSDAKSGGSSGTLGKKTKTGETYFDLPKNKRVTIREFKSSIYVDIREFYEKDGELLPGKKGVSLSTIQWNKLKELVGNVDEAIQQLC